MPRNSRKNIGSPFLHVMVQGVNKEYIFFNNEHIERYLDIIKKNKEDYNFSIIAYCIMNNHAHFLVYTEDVEKFGKFMQKVNLNYAQFYNKEQERCGVLFRNRYQAEPILNKKYLINCIKYIHDNPLKAGMVERCEDYKYSSYNDYINNRGVSKCAIMQEIFGKECNYEDLFKNTSSTRFIDIEENINSLNEYISEGIKEFIKNNKLNIYEIFSNREALKELIFFLKENCRIKYVEIRNYFEISRGQMDILKIKK